VELRRRGGLALRRDTNVVPADRRRGGNPMDNEAKLAASGFVGGGREPTSSKDCVFWGTVEGRGVLSKYIS